MALSLIPISVDSQSILCFFQSGWGYTQRGSLGSPLKLSIRVDLQGCSPPLQIYILAQKTPSPQLCHVFPAWGPPIPLNLLCSPLHIVFHTLSVSLLTCFITGLGKTTLLSIGWWCWEGQAMVVITHWDEVARVGERLVQGDGDVVG